jgi:non-canonical (house-cleaning) NTP pyrophosphatase
VPISELDTAVAAASRRKECLRRWDFIVGFEKGLERETIRGSTRTFTFGKPAMLLIIS